MIEESINASMDSFSALQEMRDTLEMNFDNLVKVPVKECNLSLAVAKNSLHIIVELNSGPERGGPDMTWNEDKTF